MKSIGRRAWVLIPLIVALALSGCKKEEKEIIVKPDPMKTADDYLALWQQGNYAAMYALLTPASRSAMTEAQFTQRYANIYEGIEAQKLLAVRVPEPSPTADSADASKPKPKASPSETAEPTELTFRYKVNLQTVAGPIAFESVGKLVKSAGGTGAAAAAASADKAGAQEAWQVEWKPAMIFPQLADGDKVRVQTTAAARGEIEDRSGQGLAVNGTAPQLGIVPGKLGDAASAAAVKAALAKKLGMTVADIDKKLGASWVKPDLFVPIGFVPEEDIADYSELPGVQFQKKNIRVYPYGEAAAHLIGYVGEINADELAKRKDQGYKQGDLVGKTGLEQALESRLRGTDGAAVRVVDAAGRTKAELAVKEAVPGETIKLTVDAGLQAAIYEEMKMDAGSVAAVEPKTGDVLALLSSPSYDPNAFERGVSAAQYRTWTDDPKLPLLNRFSKTYAPGSAFKLLTAAIGLDTRALDPKEERKIEGLNWSANSSWGSYYVKRVHDVDPVDLTKALTYSDNIYFAQTALTIGADAYRAGAAKFGIGESIPIAYPIAKSQLANGAIRSDIQLADSGYGQGEVKMSTLHAALAFSALANGGRIAYPSLIEGDRAGHPDTWQPEAMTPDTASILQQDLIAAVRDPHGVGHGAYIQGASIAGKTGTAELKAAKGAEGEEYGWFVGYNADKPDLLLAVMIEDVRQRGGSGYVAPKVKRIFQTTLRT